MNPPAPYGPGAMNADLSDRFRRVIDANLYMTIATADEVGSPWASPVYFAHAGYRAFIWVSKPGSRHSQNIAVRPHVVFSARSVAHGGDPFGLADVQPAAAIRIYRATATEHWVLDERDIRLAVTV